MINAIEIYKNFESEFCKLTDYNLAKDLIDFLYEVSINTDKNIIDLLPNFFETKLFKIIVNDTNGKVSAKTFDDFFRNYIDEDIIMDKISNDILKNKTITKYWNKNFSIQSLIYRLESL